MTTNKKLGIFRPRLVWMMASVVFPLVVLGCARLSFAQQSAPKTFASPGEASNALFQAVQNDDEQALQAILGAGKEVTSVAVLMIAGWFPDVLQLTTGGNDQRWVLRRIQESALDTVRLSGDLAARMIL